MCWVNFFGFGFFSCCFFVCHRFQLIMKKRWKPKPPAYALKRSFQVYIRDDYLKTIWIQRLNGKLYSSKQKAEVLWPHSQLRTFKNPKAHLPPDVLSSNVTIHFVCDSIAFVVSFSLFGTEVKNRYKKFCLNFNCSKEIGGFRSFVS